jgi:prepilin signal peptidase PulO-like enzyme (type II secretory pathway)
MQNAAVFLILFILGSVIGSFLNVLIDRIPRGVSPLKGRSYCHSCRRQIKSYENIPIISYIVLRGKCSGCKDIIPKRLIVVEIITSLGFVFIGSLWNSSFISDFQFVTALLAFCIFVWIFFADIDYGIIPDYANLSLIILALIQIVFLGHGNFSNHILSAFFSFAFFSILFFGTKGRGMGFGDVKLSFALGLLLGFPGIIIGLYGAFLTGALVSIILVLWRQKNFRKSTVPFGPFLVFSSLISLLYGNWIMENIIKGFL